MMCRHFCQTGIISLKSLVEFLYGKLKWISPIPFYTQFQVYLIMKLCTVILQGKYKVYFMLFIKFKTEINRYYKKEVDSKKTIIHICSSHVMKAVMHHIIKATYNKTAKRLYGHVFASMVSFISFLQKLVF